MLQTYFNSSNAYYELNTHYLFVYADENPKELQYDIDMFTNNYNSANNVSKKAIVIIRCFLPDLTNINNSLLLDTIKNELNTKYNSFIVKVIQLNYCDIDDINEYTIIGSIQKI